MREAIVLAGGFGTRLREVVPDCSKPMAPVAGRPFLEIVLRSLSVKGFSRVILSLGFMAEKIRDHFGECFASLSLDYVIEQHPLGTGGAVRLAMTHCTQDHVFIFNGDTFLDLEIPAVEALWQTKRAPIIVARQVADTARYGRILLQDNLAHSFSEKGMEGPGLINAGCYVFGSQQLDAFELNKPFSLESDFLAHLVKTKPVDVFVTEGHFIDIGVPEDYRRAQTELSGR